ncbi:hypothetical protein H0H87_003005 [Tephrocybe sp. NHM501043]|nr:hypothetical protein H0H87_003005 [Tephrocybe sp. NHM501043]
MQQQPYPGPTPNYGGYGGYAPEQPAPPADDQKSPYEGDRFKPKRTINDPFFLAFFVLQFLGFAVLSGIVLHSWISSNGLGGGLGKSGGQSGTAVTVNRSRIPLASLLLQVVMDVSKHHKSVYLVAFIALFIQAALAV